MGRIANKNLTDKQSKFIKEYLGCFNATRAAIAAGYSEKTAYSEGGRLLKNVEVAKAIKKRLDSEGITPERIKVALAEIAFDGDITEFEEFFRDGTKLSALKKSGANTQLIKAATVSHTNAGVNLKLEMYDRQVALEKLLKVYAMMTDRLQSDVSARHEFPDLTKLPEDLRKQVTKELGGPVDEGNQNQ